MEKRRKTRLAVDLLGYHEPWLDWCKAQGLTPSDAIRRAVAKVVSGPMPSPSRLMLPVPERPTARHEITLTPSEESRLIAMADADGLSVTKWIVALIRARLTGTAQFGQDELEALAQSNLQLLTIGRKLNALAKAHDIRGEAVLDDARMIAGLETELRAHTVKVSNLMTGNASRWRLHEG